MRFDDRLIRFEAVVGFQADELVVVAIAPYGRRLFTVRQRGRDISVTTHQAAEIEPVAACTIDALHRIYWAPPGGFDPIDSPATIERFATEGGEHAVRIHNPNCGYEAVVVDLTVPNVQSSVTR